MKSTLRRFAVLSGCVLAALAASGSQANAAITGAGDLAFIGINGAGPDSFQMVALEDVDPGTVIRFNENQWTGFGFNNGANGFASWTSGGAIAAGQVINFNGVDGAGATVTVNGVANGTFSGGTLTLGGAEDIFAFISSFPANQPPGGAGSGFVAGLSLDGFTGSSLTNTGLAAGTTAVSLNVAGSFATYTGPRVVVQNANNDFSDYPALIGNPANWSTTASFSSTAFSSVPEPSSFALCGLALGLIGVAGLRRRAKKAA